MAGRPETLAALGDPVPARTVLLAPFDLLVHDRRRMGELFDFDYAVEMYKPRARRRWGYYALPVLHGDRLVGKVDVTADPETGELVRNAVHEDEPFGTDLRDRRGPRDRRAGRLARAGRDAGVSAPSTVVVSGGTQARARTTPPARRDDAGPTLA